MSIKEYQQRQADCNQEKFTVETNKRLQDIELSLAELRKDFNIQRAGYSCVESSCQSQINELMTGTMEGLKGFRQDIGDFGDLIKKHEIRLQDVEDDMVGRITNEELKKELKPLKKVCDDLCDMHDKLHREVHGLIDRMKLEMVNQLKALKEELLSRPTGIPELQKLMDAKIELVELNGQNAVLRSANNEKQIMLVERKIENLYQLIKKVDLNRQELP